MNSFQPRFYRHWVKQGDLITFNIVEEETDCSISASRNLQSKAQRLVLKYRQIIQKYISQHPQFLTTLEPFPCEKSAPLIIQAMCEATVKVKVGPMASIAGAIADFAGNELLKFSPEIIIENGGDIFLRSLKSRLIGIFAGNSPLSGKIGIELPGQEKPVGISTSSGTVGHSLSFGKADAVVIVADSATLSDAIATSVGNMIIDASDINNGIEFARGVQGIKGIVIIKDSAMGLWGDIKICKTSILES